MHAIQLDQGRRIEGLGDPAADALFAHTTVGEYVRNACAATGVPMATDAATLPADAPVLVLASDLFITSTLLEAFIGAAAAAGAGPHRLALRRTPSVDFGLPLQAVETVPLDAGERATSEGRLVAHERAATEKVLFDAFACRAADVAGRAPADVLADLRARARPLVVEKRELVTDVRLPILPMAGQSPRMQFPVTSSVAMQLRHWVHVLWLNQLAPGILLNIWMRANKGAALLKALGTFSLRRDALLAGLSVIHPTARVHPTAYVEGSIVGPGAVVGARASVRQSLVAEGAEVGDHATMLGSVLGCRSFLVHRTYLVWSAIYPDAVVGNQKMQVSLVGRGTHVNAWAALIDARFQGGIKVELDGQLADTGRSFLGSCVGHGAQLAAKILVHPGRVIPNGTVVVMRPDEVISTVPAEIQPGVPMVRDGGTLRPLSALKGA